MTRTRLIQLDLPGEPDPHWDMLRLSGSASLNELQHIIGGPPRLIRAKVRRWLRAGFVRRLGDGRPERFIMTESARKHAAQPETIKVLRCSRPRSQASRIWSAMRVLKRFDLPRLTMAAEVTRGAAVRYLGLLERTGYVGVDRGGDEISYRLIHRSGPNAPVIREGLHEGRRYRVLADPNDGTIHELPARRSHDTARADRLSRARSA